jgi:hypothetical protein
VTISRCNEARDVGLRGLLGNGIVVEDETLTHDLPVLRATQAM